MTAVAAVPGYVSPARTRVLLALRAGTLRPLVAVVPFPSTTEKDTTDG